MIIVIIAAAVVAISLTSYLRLAVNSLRLAERSFHTNSAMNLAELGLEEAMSCYNLLGSAATPADAWTGWTLSGDTAVRTFSGLTLSANVTGTVKVYCERYNPPVFSPPTVVVAQSTVTLPNGAPITKMIQITIERRSRYANGIVTGNGLDLKVDATFDSWDSDPDDDPLTPTVPYSFAVRTDKGLIATAATADGEVDLFGNSVNVYGHVATGGGTIYVHGTTVIQDATSPGTPLIDPNCISTDFAATFPTFTVPTPSTVNVVSADITTSTAFPRAGDIPDVDGRYYYSFSAGASISMDLNQTITVDADATMLFQNHDSTIAIDTQKENTISLNDAATLTVYTDGNIYCKYNVDWNPGGSASALQIFGTNPTAGGQFFDFGTENTVTAAIYAPDANISCKSAGSYYGNVVGNFFEAGSHFGFHADEALGGFAGVGAGTGYGLTAWRELRKAEERATYTSELSF